MGRNYVCPCCPTPDIYRLFRAGLVWRRTRGLICFAVGAPVEITAVYDLIFYPWNHDVSTRDRDQRTSRIGR